MTVTGRPTEQRPALIDIEKLFADLPFSSPSISPDGTRIAYLAPHRGRRNVWVRGIDKAGVDAVPVTHDTRRGISSYHWTDDPRWLLYLQDIDGNEDWHLYRVDLDAPDEPAVDLTPLDPGSRVFAVDAETTVPGTAIVWMNPRPLYVDVFRIDLSTGRTTPLVERTEPAEFFLLDRAGRATWFMSKDGEGAHEVFAVDRDTGERRLLEGVKLLVDGRLPRAIRPTRSFKVLSYPSGNDRVQPGAEDPDRCPARAPHPARPGGASSPPAGRLCWWWPNRAKAKPTPIWPTGSVSEPPPSTAMSGRR